MGLAEKRAMKQVQDEVLPALKKAVAEMTGAEVEIEVDWASFEAFPSSLGDLSGGDGAATVKVFNTYLVKPLQEALKEIAADSMGKEALKGGFKKIVVKNLEDGRGRKISFSGGTYTLQDRFNGGEYFSSSKVQPAIEAGL